MRHLKVGLLGLLVLVVLAWLVGRRSRADAPPPRADVQAFAAAKKAAEDQKKWFIVAATAVWCMPCKQMENTTWRDERVVKWLTAHAVLVTVDVDKEAALAKELAVEAMPTVMAFKEGKEFDRVVGYKPAEEFLAWLDGIARGETSLEAVRARARPRDLPDGRVDVRARLDLAKGLASAGKPDEAADEYVWLWQNMLKHDPAYYGVRLSFMANDMTLLAARHAGARKRFAELRDELAAAIENDKVHRDDLVDWVTLNQVLGDGKTTLAWFDRVKEQPRGQPLLKYVERQLQELLVGEGRWADVGLLSTDPIGEIERQHAIFARMPKYDFPEDFPEEARKSAEESPRRLLRAKAGTLYAALLAANREDEAERLASRAQEIDQSPAMVAALVSAALTAGQPREQQLPWIDRAAKEDVALTSLRDKVQAALKRKG
ncbi:MAG: thioredoxin family protein [Planctomycetota bacterium]